jgi:hypothetical protein
MIPRFESTNASFAKLLCLCCTGGLGLSFHLLPLPDTPRDFPLSFLSFFLSAEG